MFAQQTQFEAKKETFWESTKYHNAQILTFF